MSEFTVQPTKFKPVGNILTTELEELTTLTNWSGVDSEIVAGGSVEIDGNTLNKVTITYDSGA